VAILEALPAAAVLELRDGEVGEEFPIVGETPQPRRNGGEALLITGIEAVPVEHIDELVEPDRLARVAGDDPRHQAAFLAATGAALRRSSTVRAVRRVSGWESDVAIRSRRGSAA